MGLIIILSCLIYNNSVRGRFILDDRVLIEDNGFVSALSAPFDILRKGLIRTPHSEAGTFRPLVMFSYALDYRFWGLDPRGYHITNNLLHAAVCVSLYFLIVSLFGHAALALWASLFFCVLPVHAEAVAYISGRNDLLAALFMLSAFIFYVRQSARQNVFYSLFAIGFFAAAFLSKESALAFPVLLVVYHAVFKKPFPKVSFFFIWFLVIAGVFSRLFLLRSSAIEVPGFAAIFQSLPAFFASLCTYLRLLVLPIGLRFGYSQRIFPWADPFVLCGMALFSILIWLFLKNLKPRPIVSFSIGWFLIALLPVSNLYPLPFFAAEHWLYLPSMGFALILAYFVTRQGPASVLRRFFFGALLLFYAVLTIQQNDYWLDPIHFNLKTLAYRPQSPILYLDLGRSYEETGRIEDAMAAYQQAIALAPDYAKAYYAMALLQQHSGNAPLATDAYLKALRADPFHLASYNNLATLYAQSGERQKAIKMLERLLELMPASSIGHYNLGNIYFDMEHYPEAIAHYEKAVYFHPGYGKAYENLAVVYFRLGRYDLSRHFYSKARQMGSQNPMLQEALEAIETNLR